MIEVAQASVTIIPTMKGAQQTITKEMTSTTDTAAQKAGKTVAYIVPGESKGYGGTIKLLVDDATLEERKKNFVKRDIHPVKGVLKSYREKVTGADEGALWL